MLEKEEEENDKIAPLVQTSYIVPACMHVKRWTHGTTPSFTPSISPVPPETREGPSIHFEVLSLGLLHPATRICHSFKLTTQINLKKFVFCKRTIEPKAPHRLLRLLLLLVRVTKSDCWWPNDRTAYIFYSG